MYLACWISVHTHVENRSAGTLLITVKGSSSCCMFTAHPLTLCNCAAMSTGSAINGKERGGEGLDAGAAGLLGPTTSILQLEAVWGEDDRWRVRAI